MVAARYSENFGHCELGDQRLSRRALSIGQALSEHVGQALSMAFETAKDLKRAYEFSLMPIRVSSH
ncbi:MAG: hypothetical protein F6K30_06680 [Cyanothece sp. SIO2G6]|nr:hypothetical protein [Cyanothece sp. SIO2G6]